MKNLFIYPIALSLMIAAFYACDSTTSPEDILKDAPAITHFHVSPKQVVFTSENDGFKDTTVTVHVQARFRNQDDQFSPRVAISKKSSNEVIGEASLDIVDSRTGTYSASIGIVTSTTSIEKYVVNLMFDEQHGSYAQTNININGFSNARPEIVEANNPEEVQRPSSGTDLYPFTATVIDSDGQETIEKVLVRVINQESGEVADSPFDLYDDGNRGDDTVAGDSIYTVTFPVNSSSKIQTFDLHYYAIDKGGLVSDTVKTTFSIVE